MFLVRSPTDPKTGEGLARKRWAGGRMERCVMAAVDWFGLDNWFTQRNTTEVNSDRARDLVRGAYKIGRRDPGFATCLQLLPRKRAKARRRTTRGLIRQHSNFGD